MRVSVCVSWGSGEGGGGGGGGLGSPRLATKFNSLFARRELLCSYLPPISEAGYRNVRETIPLCQRYLSITSVKYGGYSYNTIHPL